MANNLPTGYTNGKLLSALALLIILVTAGCLGGTDLGTGTPNTDAEATDGFPDWQPGVQDRFMNLSIGSEADLPDEKEHHTYNVWNKLDSSREIRILVWRNGNEVLNRSVNFPPQGVLRLNAYKSGNYTVKVSVAGGSATRTESQELTCNWHEYRIIALSNGSVVSEHFHQLLLCPTPTEK